MEGEYVIESIVEHRKRGKGLQYLVKWRGYEDLTWQTRLYVEKSAKAALDEYSKSIGAE